MVKHWLVCKKCGRKDVTDGEHIGTKDVMKCKDCSNDETELAKLCRYCCPTQHGTKWEN